MSIRYHKAILVAIIMVRQGTPGKEKGKSASVVFQLQKQRMMDQIGKEVLQDYDGRLWSLCYPEKEEIVAGHNNVAVTFWVDNKWTRPLQFHFIDTRFDKKGNDSVIEVRTIRYLIHFESA
jgi:hypothetical protein